MHRASAKRFACRHGFSGIERKRRYFSRCVTPRRKSPVPQYEHSHCYLVFGCDDGPRGTPWRSCRRLCGHTRRRGGAYGTAAAAVTAGQEAECATTLIDIAQERAERPGELPALVWVNAAPGTEEVVIATLDAHFSGQVPIYGGVQRRQ